MQVSLKATRVAPERVAGLVVGGTHFALLAQPGLVNDWLERLIDEVYGDRRSLAAVR